MHRIDNASAAAALPTPAAAGPVPNGFWQQGNPGTSTPSTIMDQDWFNAVQEELAGAVTAAGLTPSKTSNAQLTAAIPLLAPGRLIAVQVFNTAGTATYTPTAGMKWIRHRTVGGGGGGGGAAATAAGQDAAASGGSSGSYCEGTLTAATIGASQTITIGAGGAAIAAGNNAGGNGGQTSIGALATAPGGLGSGGCAANTYGFVAGGALPGAGAAGGIINARGISGGQGISMGNGVAGGGGGSPIARGAGGGVAVGFGNNGNPGTAPGAGGSGGCAHNGGGAQAGGAGVAGMVIIEEYA